MAELLFFFFGTTFVVLSMFLLALNDIFIGICPEGQIKVIMKSGSRHRVIHSVPGKKLVFIPSTQRYRFIDSIEERGWLHNLTGIYWIGFWPVYRVYAYTFEWNSLQVEDDGREIIRHRKEIVNSLFWRFEYILIFRGMETSDNFKTRVIIQVITEVVDPIAALFYGKIWLNILSGSAESKVRDFVGSETFEGLRGQKTEDVVDKTKDFVVDVMKLNHTDDDDANPGLEETIGIIITRVNFKSIDAEDKKVSDALEAEAIAEREGKAAVVKAKKAAKARRIEAAAEKEYLDSTELYIASNPSAVEAYKSRQYGGEKSKITSLVEKGAVNVNIGGPGAGQPPPQQIPPKRN